MTTEIITYPPRNIIPRSIRCLEHDSIIVSNYQWDSLIDENQNILLGSENK